MKQKVEIKEDKIVDPPPHKEVKITHKDMSAKIDVGIADLILNLWKNDIQTTFSCEGEETNLRYLNIPSKPRHWEKSKDGWKEVENYKPIVASDLRDRTFEMAYISFKTHDDIFKFLFIVKKNYCYKHNFDAIFLIEANYGDWCIRFPKNYINSLTKIFAQEIKKEN